MSAALARCLPDFSGSTQGLARSPSPAPPRPAAPKPIAPKPAAPKPAAPEAEPFLNPWVRARRPEPPPPPEDREALLREAEERGRARALAEARAEAEAALARERAAFEARLAEARRRWSETEAEALASGFAASLRTLDADLTGRIARLLVPVLTDALRRAAIEELGAVLGRLRADPQHAAIRVSGPPDLLDALAGRLGPLADGIAFAPGAVSEVSVVADQTVIETQVAAWTRRLSAAAET